jgi:hypothetical protein
MTKPYRSHDDVVADMFRNDPEFAAEYRNAVLAEGDAGEKKPPPGAPAGVEGHTDSPWIRTCS